MKTVKVGDREYVVKELKYKDLAGLSGADQSETAKKVLMLSTDITEEEYNELTIKQGLTLQNAVNEVNNLTDFQNPKD